MNDKSKLELVGEIAQANNKNLEYIEENSSDYWDNGNCCIEKSMQIMLLIY